MAVNEYSLGALYLAKVRTEPGPVPVHTVGITQMVPPWRVGRATLFPVWPQVGLVVGWWKKTIEDIEEDFSDEQWLSPKRFDVRTEDIREWDEAQVQETKT
jgi:hypothetical protein